MYHWGGGGNIKAFAAGNGIGKDSPGAATADDIRPPGLGVLFWMFTLELSRNVVLGAY